jgi:hypothetical protein
VATSTAVASAAAAFRSGCSSDELGGSESGGDVLGGGSLQ